MILQPENKIKQIRELKNYTQEYVAQQLGLSTRAYSKIETGETQLTINRLNEISAILEVQPMEVLGFDDKKVFNFYNSSDINNVKNMNMPEKLIQQYEETIQALKEQIAVMKLLMGK
ncbi:MAG: XRE family transcriptional regulator [Flavobacteriia bacterium]|jgi:transcriptional regulator with XRE-family HTH domain|nr:MAG: XRE family transcriptional regulator [Flavobacteriia bacterium]